MPRPQKPGLLRRIFLENWRNKGTSLMFAVLIWAFAFDNTKQSLTIPAVPLRIESADPGRVVLRTEHPETKGDFPASVAVVLRGPRNLLKRINSTERDMLVGEFKVAETSIIRLDRNEGYPNLPRGVTVEQATPKEVSVTLDELGRRIEPVLPMIEGTPSPEFREPTREDITIEPREVEIVGPSSLLQHYRVQTERWSIEGMEKASDDRPLTIHIAPRAGTGSIHRGISFAEGTPSQVRGTLKLKSALEQGGPFRIPVRLAIRPDTNRPPLSISRADAEVSLSCRGTPAALAELERLVRLREFSIWIDVEDYSGALTSVESSRFRWAEGLLPAGIERDSLVWEPSPLIYTVELQRDDGTED